MVRRLLSLSPKTLPLMKRLLINKLKRVSKAKATKIRKPLSTKKRKEKNKLKTLIIMKTSSNVGSQNMISKKYPLTMNR
jgi:hypothetical protein